MNKIIYLCNTFDVSEFITSHANESIFTYEQKTVEHEFCTKKTTTLFTPKNYEMPLQQATMKRGVIDIDICVGFIIFYLPDDRKCYVYD